MKFKVGDRVKFLNENGGGIVSKILASNMVNVAIEDGFEIPTLTSDLIKTGLPESAGNFFEETFDVELTKEAVEEAESEANDRISPISTYSTTKAATPGIYLAFVPQDQKWLITGMLDIFLINSSDNEALFSLYLKNTENKTYSGVDYDLIPKGSMIHIDTIDRDSLEKWSAGVIQVLLHKDISEKVLLPVNSQYNIKAPRFYKENNYVESSFFESKSIVLTIAEISELIHQATNKERDDKTEKKIQSTKPVLSGVESSKIQKEDEIIEKHRVKGKKPSSFFKTAEVDLHIHELLEDHSKMSPDEILKYQMAYFIRCLESAISNKYSKVVFIHGIGNGTLKDSVITKLQEYDFIRYDDAVLSRFGKGAIEVKIFFTKN